MYLQFLNKVSYFFNLLFLLLILRTFLWPYLVKIYRNYKAKKSQKEFDAKEAEYKEQKMQPFFFEHGRVKIWAKSLEQAKAMYKEKKPELKKLKK